MLFDIFMIAGLFLSENLCTVNKHHIKTPSGDEPFGGENKGIVTTVPKEHSVNLIANMTLVTEFFWI
jgi:hypothetical protein